MKPTRSEYRFKIRGPPKPLRPSPIPQHLKKWHMPHHHLPPPRMPVRQRPIPLHNHHNYKSHSNLPGPPRPMPPPAVPPISLPIRNLWKNTIFKAPEKPFQSSPPVNKLEYDYHVQTNNIPTHTSPIKQLDYKGPIHTIPAPNLSPADKPKNIEEVQPIEQEKTIVQIQKAHQYQVTESTDPVYSSFNKQPYYDLELSKNHDNLKTPQTEIAHKDTTSVTTQDLLKLLNTYNQQPQLLNGFTLPLIQPQLTRQQINPYQALLSQPQIFQAEPTFADQFPQSFTQNYKTNLQPQLHTFNYEENPQPQEGLSSSVSSDYTLDPETAESFQNTFLHNPVEALAQTQYVQRFFDTRDDNVATNNVEPDARPAKNFEADQNNEEIVSGAYYTILPNREAAEALASLQEAGKLNSNNMQQTQNIQVSPHVPMTIYVPDEYEENQSGQIDEDRSNSATNEKNENNNRQYEEVNEGETETENARSKKRNAFANRNKPKKN